MDCVDARQDIAPGLFGALDETDRSALAEHLERCGSCRTEHEELAELLPLLELVQFSGLGGAPVPHPPLPDPQRAVEAVRAEAARPSNSTRGGSMSRVSGGRPGRTGLWAKDGLSDHPAGTGNTRSSIARRRGRPG
ncbi:zf-HC2 domain-containing protein [Streptomyces sp. NPDC093586]|uniref:zf-HC2 domain-containing protein n=1 Tax=Streptomyces sp. NPDC093586 TaxID=3366042 RepID=UPI003803228B